MKSEEYKRGYNAGYKAALREALAEQKQLGSILRDRGLAPRPDNHIKVTFGSPAGAA